MLAIQTLVRRLHWILLLPTCRLNPTHGTPSHILTECIDLKPAWQRVYSLWSSYLKDKPSVFPIVMKYTIDCPTTKHMQFLMDCTVLPDVILLHQKDGKVVHDSLLYLTRTFCYSIYKSRSKLQGKWNVSYRWMILCLRTSEDDKTDSIYVLSERQPSFSQHICTITTIFY